MEKGKGMREIDLPLPAELLVPHRWPMLFVDSLVRRWDDSAVAQAILPVAGISISDNRLLPEFFVELIAQSVAMANGYDALCQERPAKNGMLVGVDGFSFASEAVPGRMVRIETEKTFSFGAVKIIRGGVFDADELLASGNIKVWEDPD